MAVSIRNPRAYRPSVSRAGLSGGGRRPSGLDRFFDIAGGLLTLGHALRGLQDRRRQRKIVEERAAWERFLPTINDQMQRAGLAFPADYTGLEGALQPIVGEAHAWIEKNVTTDENKAYAHGALTTLTNRTKAPVLRLASQQQADSQIRKAQELTGDLLLPSVVDVARDLVSGNPVDKQNASQAITTAIKEIRNPDGATMQQAGPYAAAHEEARLLKEVERAVAREFIIKNKDGDLVRLRHQWMGDGFPAVGRNYGASMTDQERNVVWSRAMQDIKWLNDQEQGGEAGADGQRETEADALHLALTKHALETGGFDDVEMQMRRLESLDPNRAARLHRTDWNETRLTRAQAEAEALEVGRVDQLIKSQDPSDPATKGRLAEERVAVANDDTLHFQSKMKIDAMLMAASGEVDRFNELPPDVRARVRGLTAFDQMTRNEQGLLFSGLDEGTVGVVRNELAQALQEPSVDNAAALRVAERAVFIPDGQTALGIMKMYRDPKLRVALRDDPAKYLPLVPGMPNNPMVYIEDERGRLDQVAIIAEMQARGWDVPPLDDDEPGLSDEIVAALPFGQGGSYIEYANMVAVLQMLQATFSDVVHVDEAARQRQEMAREERMAVQELTGSSPTQTGQMRRRRR